MAAMLAPRPQRTHANPRSARLDAISAGSSMARMDANDLGESTQRPIREIAVEVLREMGISQKSAAITAGCAESDFSSALNGKQRLEIEWLRAQGPVFMRRLNARLEAEDQSTPEAIDQEEAAQLARMFEVLVRRAFRVRSRGVA
jgi:hypothetical protein